MIAPTFHINILKSFMTVFNQNSVNVVNKMRSEMNKTFDVHDYMSGVTVDILLGNDTLLITIMSLSFSKW
jgi:cytochrome P450 family 4